MERQTIQDIAAVLVARNGLDKTEANRFVAEMFALIQERLEIDKIVKVKGLGTFKIVGVEARESVSVRTGQRVVIDGHSKITFIPDAIMKDLVNKPFSQFETVVLNDGVDFEDLKAEEQNVIDEDTEEISTPIEEETTVSTTIEEEPTVSEPVEKEPQDPSIQPLMEVVDDEPAADDSEEDPTLDDAVEDESVSDDVIENEPISDKVEDEPVGDVVEDEPAFEEDSQNSWLRWLLGGLLVLALMAASAYGGYYFGSQKQVQPVVPDTIVIHDTVTVAPIDTVATEVTEAVSATEAIDGTEVTDAPKAADTESAPPSNKVEKKEPAVAEPVVDKYAEKDARVRLGAYRIVGLDHEVTVLAGQTFYSICRAHLGPDMECYVEVYNNLPKNPIVKAGQVIKIPKLQLKKKRKTNKS